MENKLQNKDKGLGFLRHWKVMTMTLLLLTFSIGQMWGAVTTEVYNATDASSSTDMVKTGSTLAGTYIAGQGGGNIKDYSPSNKGVKLRTKQATVTISETTYGYAVITANTGYVLKSVKVEGTSNDGTKTIPMHGVYVDVDATNATTLATTIAAATNQLSSTVVFPGNGTTYVSSPTLSINASTNIVLLFDNGSDYNNQMRAIITIGYEAAGADPDPTITFNDGAYSTDGAALDLSTLFTSNSTGAVTYTVKTDGGTGASIDGTSFTATAEGTAVVTASQAAVSGSYAAKSVDANIVVSEPYSVQVPATALTLPNFPAEGWTGKVTPSYYNNGSDGWYVLSPYELYQSRTNLTWTDCSNPGSSDMPEYAAYAPFPASSTWGYGGGDSKVKIATVNSKAGSLKGPYVYRVKKCLGVALYGASGSNGKRTVYLKAFEVTAGVAATTPVKTASFESNSATAVSISGLDSSKEYVIEISQKNAGSAGASEGNSVVYAIAFLAPVCTNVAAPTDLTCSAQTVNSLTYTWTKASHASGYTATLYSDSGCETEVESKDLGDVATVTFTGLSNSTTYYCKVQSKGDGTDYCENGGTASAVSGTTEAPSCGAVTAPTLLMAGSITADGATFTIIDDADAFNYELYVSTSSTAPEAETAATYTSTTKSKDITGLTSGTTYYAWVRSVCDASHKSAWVALNTTSFKVRTTPTASFADAVYVIGASAIDVAANFTSNSEAAVVYELKEATANAEVTSAGVFSATVAGEYVVVANQAGNATYTPISKEATVTVLDNELSDIYIWSKASKYGGDGKCVTGDQANTDANANAALTTLNYSSLTMSNATSMGRPGDNTVVTLTFAATQEGFAIKDICTFGKLEEALGGQIRWDDGEWTALAKYGSGDGEKKTFSAPTGTFPTTFSIKFTSVSSSEGGLWWRNALVTLEVKKTVTGVTEALTGAEINGAAISSENLATLLADKTLDIATAYAAAPTVTFKKQVTTSYAGGWAPDVTNVDVEVTASDNTTAWQASATINAQAYTINIAKPAGPSLETEATAFTLTSAKIATDTKNFTFSGVNLEHSVSIALESAVAGMDVTPAVVLPVDGAITDQEVTITYKSLENVAEAVVNLVVAYDEDTKITIPLTYSSTVGYEELTSVSAAMTWNWNGAADAAYGTLGQNDMIILANADVTWDEGFNARAIAGKLQHYYRDGKYAQGNELKFNTTIPGKVYVTYSNTGGNAARTVNVNGTKGSLSSSNNKDADKCTEAFAVSAGDVLIKGVLVSDDSDQMLRYYEVRFAPVYSVTYNAGEGAVKGGETMPTQADEAAGETITLAAASALEKAGYDFTGWLCNIDGLTYDAGADYTMTAAATTFTAQWTLHVDPVDPTLTYDDGAYTVGGAALDLSTLITAQTSTGAITYSVKTDGGTSASIDGKNFTATAAGTATITASQAAVLGYNAITVDFEVVVSEAAEIDGIKMVVAEALTGNFVTARTLSNGDNTIEGIAYTKYLTMSSTMTSFGNEVAPSATKGIYYYPSHKNIRFYFYVYNNQSSAKKIYFYTVDEDAEGTSDATSANVSVDPGRHLVYADVELTKHAAVVFGVENTGTQICQIVAVESGDELLQGGEAGYTIDYNKCYISPKAGTVAVYDGIEYKLYADAKLVSATNVQLQTLGTDYIKFHLDAPMTVNVYADNKKYYIGSECSTDDAAMLYEATGDGEFSLAAGDWYINGSGVQVKINKLSFSAPKCAEPAFNALANSEICDGDAYVALDGTATVADAGVPTYQWYNADGDEAIDGATAAEFTPTADGSYYVIATNHLAGHSDNAKQSATVTVTTFASAQITSAPVDQRREVGEEATLSVVATGKAPLSYQWYTCDENGDNTVIITGAEEDSYSVTVTDGLDQYYKVVVSSGCGEASAIARIVEWVALPQLSVSATTTWDWVNAGENIKLTSGTTPAKNEECVMANVKVSGKMPTNDATFNSQALLFCGENVRAVDGGRAYASVAYIKFNTTVSGKVTVEFSTNTDDKVRCVKINGVASETSDKKATVKTFSTVVPAGEVSLVGYEGETENQYIRISKIIFSTTDVDGADYTREVTQGRFGTICLPNGGVMVGASLYEVAYYGQTSEKIFFDEIVNGVMEAGVPYIFLPREGATQLGVYYTDAVNATAGNHNGLYGSYSRTELPSDGSCYILLNNQYCQVLSAENYVGANKAYLKLDDITPVEPALVPGRRRMSMSVVRQTPTGLENGELLNGENGVQKVLINGELFILRGEKMYDATGRLVK